MSAEERWLPARGYAGFYEVSDQGNVDALARPCTHGGLLKPQLNSAGYRMVRLHKYGRVRTVTVGRLVLETFRWPPPSPASRARHGPGGKPDDSLANLRWGLATLSSQKVTYNYSPRMSLLSRYVRFVPELTGGAFCYTE